MSTVSNSSGTLGYFVRKSSEVGIITCTHVALAEGSMITSPSLQDGGRSPDNIVGETMTVVYSDDVDGAYVKLKGDAILSSFALKDGTVVVGQVASVGDEYMVCGRTSGIGNTGHVTSTDFTIKYGGRIYHNQLLLLG